MLRVSATFSRIKSNLVRQVPCCDAWVRVGSDGGMCASDLQRDRLTHKERDGHAYKVTDRPEECAQSCG